jgi:hypothetical protein
MARARGRVVSGEVILDFSQVRPFEPLDSSRRYLCTVTKLVNEPSKSGGRPVSNLELTIKAPEEVQVEEWVDLDTNPHFVGLLERTTPAKGRILFRTYVLDQPTALPFLHEFLRAMGVPQKDLETDTFRYNVNDYIGLECSVDIVNEAYNEQVRSRPKKIRPASDYQG